MYFELIIVSNTSMRLYSCHNCFPSTVSFRTLSSPVRRYDTGQYLPLPYRDPEANPPVPRETGW